MGLRISITINVAEDGQIGIIGPLHDKVTCYGLLEVARDIIRDFKPQAGGIVVPGGAGNIELVKK